jgi:hypothetical protein
MFSLVGEFGLDIPLASRLVHKYGNRKRCWHKVTSWAAPSKRCERGPSVARPRYLCSRPVSIGRVAEGWVTWTRHAFNARHAVWKIHPGQPHAPVGVSLWNKALRMSLKPIVR